MIYKNMQVKKSVNMKSCVAKLKWRAKSSQLIILVNKIVKFWKQNDSFYFLILAIRNENISFSDLVNVFVLGSKVP